MKKSKFILSLCATLLFAGMISQVASSHFQTDPVIAFISTASILMLAALFTKAQAGVAFGLTYSPLVVKKQFWAEIFHEILYANNTFGKNYVNFMDGIKDNLTLTQMSSVTSFQAYLKSGVPTVAGGDGLTIQDTNIVPVKLDFYDTFAMEDLRTSRFQSDMVGGALNIESNEFASQALMIYAPRISSKAESQFWNGAKAGTATTVAALTPGTGRTSVGAAEQTYVAAAPVTLFDGVVTKLIYNSLFHSASVGLRAKVVGTTLSSTNIAAEMAKLYAAIDPKLLQDPARPLLAIYAPLAVQQFIDIFNISATYRDLFGRDNAGNYTYNGIPIYFVPVPSNCMIAALKSELFWLQDSGNDMVGLEIKKLPDPDHAFFIRNVHTHETAFTNEADKVLYLG